MSWGDQRKHEELVGAIYDQYADRLANANAIILDYRWSGGGGKFTRFDILPHLTQEDLHYAAAHVPQIVS